MINSGSTDTLERADTFLETIEDVDLDAELSCESWICSQRPGHPPKVKLNWKCALGHEDSIELWCSESWFATPLKTTCCNGTITLPKEFRCTDKNGLLVPKVLGTL